MFYDYTVFAGTQGVQNHRKTDRIIDLAEEGRLPFILFAEGGGGDSEAAGEDRVESGLLDKFGTDAIVHAGQYEDIGLFQNLPELCCFRSHLSSSRCGLRVPTAGSLASAEGGMKIERSK